MFASLYSDYARRRLENQLGIAQASVTANNFLDVEGLGVQVGVFWDRFGYIEPYDTYMFGRTHQGGAKVSVHAARRRPRPGRHRLPRGRAPAEPGHDADRERRGAYPVGPVEVGAYVLRTWTRDKRAAVADPGRHDVRHRPRREVQAPARPRLGVPRVRLLQHGPRRSTSRPRSR